MLIFQQRQDRARTRLENYLSQKYSGRSLNNDEIVTSGLFGDFDHVWEIEIGAQPSIPQLYLGIDQFYPSSLPKVIVRAAEDWHLKVPHVEKNGSICVLPQHASPDQTHFEEVIEDILARSIKTLESGLSGDNHSDFLEEIETYWPSQRKPSGYPMWFIGDPHGVTRAVFCVTCNGFILIGDSEKQCRHWLRNYLKTKTAKFPFQTGLFVSSAGPLFPADYFRNANDFISFVSNQEPSCLGLLSSLADGRRQMPVILGITTTSEIALLGLTIKDSSSKPRQRFSPIPPRQKMAGFRAGKLPPTQFALRFGKDLCERQFVHRAYHEWLHSRGGATGTEQLWQKSVVIIGGGSIGGDVAQLLCNSGIKKITIIDHDVLSLDNIGRHLLGAREVGRPKAQVLQSHLAGQFPESDITSIESRLQDVLTDNPDKVFKSDLILALTGHWPTECLLNAEARARPSPPILYGWTEPHGHAGHALLVGPRGGCLACGRDAFGQVMNRVTEWPSGELKSIPACGGFYQPYGAIETGPIKSMIASLAIECLQSNPLRSELRSWLGNRKFIENLGGRITDIWQTQFEDPPTLGKVVSQDWKVNNLCPQCMET